MYQMIVIDDEPINFYAVDHIIEWEKYEIEITGHYTSGEEGYLHIVRENPEIVLSDISMPDLTGLEMIARVRKLGIDTEFVFLTAYRNFQFACQALEHQAFAYLLKPLNREELLRHLPRLLNRLSEKSAIGIPVYDVEYNTETIPSRLRQYLSNSCIYSCNRVVVSDAPLLPPGNGASLFPISIRQAANAYLYSSQEKEMPEMISCGYSLCRSNFDSFPKMAEEAILSLDGEFPFSSNRMTASVQAYIAAHFAEDISVSDLARNLAVSESYLCTAFKKNCGNTIVNFIRHIRIHNAMRLIRTTPLDIVTISEKVGYNSYSYFGKQFKEETGCTPSGYKRMNS